jgi:2-polyprenyl-3-methyl-5-hydroxy-6-metoxy-1,4-benzoquinol methylase
MMVKLFSKIKSSLRNNENKNGLINCYLLDNYTKKDDFTLVDAGCGNGSNLNDIITKYPYARFIGIDNYKPDLDIAKIALEGKADFLLCDCLDIKLDNKSVDIVLSNQVIEHITKYEKYVSEIKRILKDKGLLIISTPNFLHPRNIFLKLFLQRPIMRWENSSKLPPDEYRGHIKEFKKDELISLLEKI